MYIKILKQIPVASWHLIEIGAIYYVYKHYKQYYLIKSWASDIGIWIKESEAKILNLKRRKMKVSDLAKCIKYLEMIKWGIDLGFYERYDLENSIKTPCKFGKPIEYYFINEFPFSSAMCYIFSRKRVKDEKGRHICFCPKKPYDHPEWPTIKNNPKDVYWNRSRRSCILYKGEDGKSHHRPVSNIYQEVSELSILDIMNHLKPILSNIPKYKLKHLSSLWHIHLKWRYNEWERQKKNRW